jgi:hypothetical protein
LVETEGEAGGAAETGRIAHNTDLDPWRP